VTIRGVAVENLGDLLTACLLVLRVDLLPLRSDCTRSRIELGDVKDRELVALDQLTSLLVVSLILSGEATDDIRCQSHRRHLIFEEIAHFIELLSRVLAIHFVEHIVAAALHGHMQELVDSGVLHDVSHGLQMLENVGWVGHAESKHTVVRHHLDDSLEKFG